MTALLPPGPETIAAIRVNALVHELARSYFERRGDQAADVDARLHQVDIPGPPGAGDDEVAQMRAYMPVESAALMLEDWLRHTASTVQLAGALPVAAQLAAEHAPPVLREDLVDAVDRVAAGEADLLDTGPAGLTGVAGAHLLALVVAALITRLHPIKHNHARLLLERQIRASHTVGQGMPAAEGVVAVSDTEARQALTHAVPWIVEMTDARHEKTNSDLLALTKLYLLDHPAPGPAEADELNRLIGRRLEELTTGLDTAASPVLPRPRTPAVAPLTPEQVAARQRAERDRRRSRKKR